jgi:translation initiation factor IF-1
VSGDALTMQGVVRAARGGGHFVVDCEIGGAPHEVLCKTSGRLVLHRIRVLPGDGVTVEVSPYDLSKGRITYREDRRT